MHLENGEIIGDTGDERLVISQAEIEGADPWDFGQYPGMFLSPPLHQKALMERLERGFRKRIGSRAVVRGLTRLAMSQRSTRAVAVDVLSQLAEKAIEQPE